MFFEFDECILSLFHYFASLTILAIILILFSYRLESPVKLNKAIGAVKQVTRRKGPSRFALQRRGDLIGLAQIVRDQHASQLLTLIQRERIAELERNALILTEKNEFARDRLAVLFDRDRAIAR